MKSALLALGFVFAANSASASVTPPQLLSLLIQNSSQVEVTEASGRVFSTAEFSDILAEFLATGKSTRTESSVRCERDNSAGGSRVGAVFNTCVLSLNNTGTGREAGESSMLIEMRIVTPVVPNAKPSLLDKKINVFLAG